MFGLEPGKFKKSYEAYLNAIHPDDKERINIEITTALEKSDNFITEYRIVKPNGTVRWMEDQAKIFFDDHGEPNRLVGIVHDITDKIHMQNELEEKHQLLSTIYQNIDVGISVINITSSGEFVYESINPKYEELIGIKSEDIINKSPQDFVAMVGQENVDKTYSLFNECVKSRNMIESEVFIAAGVAKGWWLRRHSPLFNKEGKIYKILGVGVNITEKKETELKIRAIEERLSKFIDSALESFHLLDGNLNIIEINKPALIALVEGDIKIKDKNDVLGENFFTVYPGLKVKKWAQCFSRIIKTGKPVTTEDKIEHPIRGERYLIIQVFKVMDGLGIIATDITDRKTTENRLKTSQHFLNNIIDQSPFAMWISDEEGTLIRLNQACRELLNITDQEVVGKYNVLKDNIVKEQGFLPLVSRVFQKGKIAKFRIRYDSATLQHLQLKETAFVILDVTIFPIKDTNGKVTNAVIQHNNVTEKILTDEALIASETRYRQLYESLRDAYIQSDLVGNLVAFNQVFIKILGYSEDELKALKYQDLTPKKWHKTELKIVEEQIFKVGYSEVYEKEYIKKDGSIIPVELRVFLIKNDSGDPTGMWAIVRDITERKAYEKRILENEKRFRTIANITTDLIYEWNVEDDHLEWYGDIEKALGYNSGDIPRTIEGWIQLIHPQDQLRLKDSVERHRKSQKPIMEEYRMKRKDRTYSYWIDQGAPILDKDGKPVKWIGGCLDITANKKAQDKIKEYSENLEKMVTKRTLEIEKQAKKLHDSQKALTFLLEDVNETSQRLKTVNVKLSQEIEKRKLREREIEKINARLIEANKDLESFSYSVSHDLRAPLRHMNVFSNFLNEDYSNRLEEKGRHYIDVILESSNRMNELIDHLLEFSRTGRAKLRKKKTDFNQLIEKVINELIKDMAGREIEWEIKKLPLVNVDPNLLRNVWTNLISNAIKYSKTKKTAKIIVGYSIEKENSEITFFIRDNGVGFDMKYKDKLFGVFQRLHSTEKFKGHGIGLANVKRIIQRHGGKVWAIGDVDKGATFFFSIPRE